MSEGSEFHCFGAQWAKQRWPKVSVVGDTKYLGVCLEVEGVTQCEGLRHGKGLHSVKV